MNESIGILSEAYFASRTVILEWINALLGLNYTKIEQTASGVAACQVFDALFPDQVRLEKVNFNAKRDYEFVKNYKVLQATFDRVGIKKQIEVERLIRGKYQDNLEFMQWVKGFFEQHASEEAVNYDGAARREALGRSVPATTSSRGGGGGHTSGPPSNTVRRAAVVSRPVHKTSSGTSSSSTARRPNPTRAAKENRTANNTQNMVKKSEYEALQAQFADLNTTLEDSETEKQFYFTKLREIEIIIQALEDESQGEPLDPVLEQIRAILYKAEHDADADPDGQLPPDDGALPDDAGALLTGDSADAYGDLPPENGEDEYSNEPLPSESAPADGVVSN